jgi:hypothetical protein
MAMLVGVIALVLGLQVNGSPAGAATGPDGQLGSGPPVHLPASAVAPQLAQVPGKPPALSPRLAPEGSLPDQQVPAAGSPNWSIEQSRDALYRNGNLSSVACTGSAWCVAVGSGAISTSQFAQQAETWNGTAWVMQAMPNPNGIFSWLTGVSCISASACTAVGTNVNNSGAYVTLAEAWNGTVWIVQAVPNPSGSYSQLNGVSCTSASACTAVGSAVNNSGITVTLAEAWNGTTWTIQTTPNPTGAIDSELDGVSCISATACTAVGNSTDGAGTATTLAEVWNGSVWTVQATPNLTGATASTLQGVSCTSATTCTAVGTSTDSVGVTLAEAWNGTVWNVQATPNPTGARASKLQGVSCTSATTCTAVGNSTDSVGVGVTLAEAWNGTDWATEKTPSRPSSSGRKLEAVSCTSVHACTAVGSATDRVGAGVTLAEAWNGVAWTVQATPDQSGYVFVNNLWGVSCSSASACMAGGNPRNTQAWNGTSWHREENPSAVLYGLSCISASTCTAVGYAENSSRQTVSVAEGWNGNAWTVQATPSPPGATGSELEGVSCTSATTCTAVGYYTTSAGTAVTLAEVWNGTAWALESIPNPSGTTGNYLEGVSCASTSACIAVGTSTTSAGTGGTLAEAWDGTAWTVQATPTSSGGFNGVSCSSPTACTAVGGYGGSTLAEAWNGTTWSVETTPNRTGSTGSFLEAVSCTSTRACTAVGTNYNKAGNLMMLAEVWKGNAWSIQSTPAPTGSFGSELNGVSCTAANVCTAVGEYYAYNVGFLTLAVGIHPAL